MRRSSLIVICLVLLWVTPAAGEIATLCPAEGIQPRPAEFTPGGIILTTFDRSSLWVYDIDRNARYPLPDTVPCGTNCHLSQDARWITYYDSAAGGFGKMRVDGTGRTPLARNASEVLWWNPDTLLVWTPEHDAYLQQEDGTVVERLNADGVTSIQPGGYWGIVVEQFGADFVRFLVNTAAPEERIVLGFDIRYFSTAAWSPDGAWLAFTAPVLEGETPSGTEIFGIRPGDAQPTQWTTLGAVRINGHAPNSLSWSPDGTRLAFWVLPLDGDEATLHILDVASGDLTAYCGYTTIEHTPNPPRLVWSPDGTHIAFGGNVPGDEKGYLLLALDVESGALTELSNGIYPALGSADVIAWGQR